MWRWYGSLNKQFLAFQLFYFIVIFSIFQITSVILHLTLCGFWFPEWPYSLSTLAGRWSLYKVCLCWSSRLLPSGLLNILTRIIHPMRLLCNGERVWVWGHQDFLHGEIEGAQASLVVCSADFSFLATRGLCGILMVLGSDRYQLQHLWCEVKVKRVQE